MIGDLDAVDPDDGHALHSAGSAESLLRLGVSLAIAGVEALAVLTDSPLPGVVDAADRISDAADFLGAGEQP